MFIVTPAFKCMFKEAPTCKGYEVTVVSNQCYKVAP